MTASPIDQRARIRRAFAGAEDYDGHARVQAQVARDLAARISRLGLPPSPKVLEIGCGTGFLTQALADTGLAGDWLVTDVAPEMVERCRSRFVNAVPGRTLHFGVLDGELGKPDRGAFDLICSSLAVQWFDDAPAALSRLATHLAPGGHLVVATLGPESFAQWRAAHEALGIVPGTPDFAPVSGFSALPGATATAENYPERHADPRAFLRALKAIGAATARDGHRPLNPAQLRRVMDRFAQTGCEVTYQVVTCHLRHAR